MSRNSAERRHNDAVKATRKKNICIKHYDFNYYNNLHQYSKNKIHCSCPLCAAKTNSKYVHGGRFNGKNPCLRDRKTLESMSQQMEEYENEVF